MSTIPAQPSGTEAAEAILSLARELQPICRSITGDGLRETLRILSRELPLNIREVPSGTQVLDWTVPDEWNIRDAYIKNSKGERLVDFQKCALHVINYSVPIRATMMRNWAVGSTCKALVRITAAFDLSVSVHFRNNRFHYMAGAE